MLRWYSKKRFKQRLGGGVMSCCIIRQQIELSVHFILSTVECGIYFAEPDTILVFMIFSGLFKGGTRLAMPNIMRAGLIVIEAWFRGY